MKTKLLLGLALVLGAILISLLIGQYYNPNSTLGRTPKNKPISEAELRSRIMQIRVGMSRPEILSLFPVFSESRKTNIAGRDADLLDSGVITTITGSGQVEAYRVSSEWIVYVPYDFSKPVSKVKGDVTLERIAKRL